MRTVSKLVCFVGAVALSAVPGAAAEPLPGTKALTDEGDLARKMVDDARVSGISAFRQINQRFPSGLEIPIEFTTVLLGGRAGMLAIGKNLQAVAELQSRLIAAQQTMERDYWKLREIEAATRSGTTCSRRWCRNWIPAFAGMTVEKEARGR